MQQTTLLILLFLLLPLIGRAQIFGFPDDQNPYARERQHRRHDTDTQTIRRVQYKGGTRALERDLLRAYRTQAADEPQASGRIIIACIVSPKGRVEETHIVSGISPKVNAEAQRVCRKLHFIPAKRGKQRVRSRYDVVLPIRRGRLTFTTLETIDV